MTKGPGVSEIVLVSKDLPLDAMDIVAGPALKMVIQSDKANSIIPQGCGVGVQS